MKEIETKLREHRAWVETNALRIEARELGHIADDLAEGSPAAHRCIPDALYALATVYGSRGVAGLLNGDPGAKAELARAIDYWAIGLEIRAKLYFQQPTGNLNLTNHLALAACVVCASRNWTTGAERILRRMVETPDAVDLLDYDRRRFASFVLACCDFAKSEQPLVGMKEPYAALLEHWHDTERLARALYTACEYRVQNWNDARQELPPEFSRVPFDILPCEVLLVRRRRAQLGLPMPDVEHELVRFFDEQIGELPEVVLDQTLESVLQLM